MKKTIFIFIAILSTTNCFSQFKLNYNLNQPSKKTFLPQILHEISGIVAIDSLKIACIQDEIGSVYIFNLSTNKIENEIKFSINGDYEGITKVEDTLFVLRSDGVLFEIKKYLSKQPTIREYKTLIPAINNEGLCYDKQNNRLLIGQKGKINKDKINKDLRCIYEFDLSTKKLNQKPVYEFSVKQTNSDAKSLGMKFPFKETKKGKLIEIGLKFNTSEISIHPITKQLYVLSASDFCLLIYNSLSELIHIEKLNSKTFNKAEGMSFFENGDLIISNEGQNDKPTLLQFHFQ